MAQQSGGNKKKTHNKGARDRYKAEDRRMKNKKRAMRRHLRAHPGDEQNRNRLGELPK